MTAELDRWLSPAIRGQIEQRYYAEINRRASLAALIGDPSFRAALGSGRSHVGLYSDHGIVHARDVARQTLTVLERVHGVLIPRRPAARLAFLQGLGVLLAYVHDIGMVDFSRFGRVMHPEYVVKAVLGSEMDDLVAQMWSENSANLAWHLTQLAQAGALRGEPQRVLRELLSLAIGHSKSKIPVAILNDRAALRARLLFIAAADLRQLYAADSDGAPPESPPPAAAGSPADDDAFAWLLSEHPAARQMANDAIDAVRVLRAADALRQRGLVLKTSGGYEMFISRITGRAVYSFQSANGRNFLLELQDIVSAGEAIVAGSELDANGNLRVAFHRGAFDTPQATQRAVEAAAHVVRDIAQDTLDSFRRPAGDDADAGLRPADRTLVLLEQADDSADFAARVRQRILDEDAALRGRVRLVPSLRDVSERERALYLAAAPLHWDMATRSALLQRLQAAGNLCEGIDPRLAFEEVRLARVRPGDVLIEGGAPAAFVYLPLGEGLRVIPLGGYEASAALAWAPLGITGVIRGAPRNATIVAERELELLIIPKAVYLREWYRPYTPDQLLNVLSPGDTQAG